MSSTSTPNQTAATQSPAASGQGGMSENLVGNRPSSILFFIALTVGVCIALLFIFFTVRYFVRSKYGLYVPYRSRSAGQSLRGTGSNTEDPSGLRFTSVAVVNNYQAAISRAALRYRKKRTMTKDEVEELFPVKTYDEWLNGGKESDANKRANDSALLGITEETPEMTQPVPEEEKGDNIEMEVLTRHESTKDSMRILSNDLVRKSSESGEIPPKELDLGGGEDVTEKAHETNQDSEQRIVEIDLGSSSDSPHFSSGTCAICIDLLEPQHDVRGLLCGHVFHKNCIDPWLIERKVCCPMCKRDYYTKSADDTQSLMEGVDGIAGLPRSVRFRAEELMSVIEHLRDTPPDNTASLEQLAREYRVNLQDLENVELVANEKVPLYYNWRLALFWKCMGITRLDIFNYWLVKTYEANKERRILSERPPDAGSPSADPVPPETV